MCHTGNVSLNRKHTLDKGIPQILWKNENDEVETYQFNRVLFGANASPFLAQYVAMRNADRDLNMNFQ